jgi:hypothetical protein
MRSATAANAKTGCFVSVNQNLGESVSQTKFKKLIAWLGVRPSVSVAMGNNQSTRLGCFLEPFVVVSIASTAILNSVYVVEIVNHFVKECCDHVLDRS